jgi:hypothetical protein
MTLLNNFWVYFWGTLINIVSKCLYTYVFSSSIHNRKYIETAYLPTNKWIYTEDVVYSHNGILLSHKAIKSFAIKFSNFFPVYLGAKGHIV